MGFLRPATPGFVVTLAATALLAVVSFSVPWFKSVYFMKATIKQDNFGGAVTFGVLGYCFEVQSTVACSNATVGYEFDPNALFGVDLPLGIEIPSVVVKWLTYAFVLHIVALGAAAVATVFGLLAHVREFSMVTCSTCFSGIAAGIAMLAFIFDIVFFFVSKSRIEASGGTAEIGIGLWLTLAAWVMLFFSGCFFGFGRCCLSNRTRQPRDSKHGKEGSGNAGAGNGQNGQNGGGYNNGSMTPSHSESVRMEAIRAENERKARQAEAGLPAFPTQAEAVPLRKPSETQYYYEEDSEDDHQPYRDQHLAGASGRPGPNGGVRRQGSGYAETTNTQATNVAGRGRAPVHPGYSPAPPGRNPIDAYNAGVHNRGASGYPASAVSNPGYRQPSNSGYGFNAPSSPPPPMPMPMGSQAAQPQQFLAPPVGIGEVYGQPGHSQRQSSYHSAVSHQAGQSTWSAYEPQAQDNTPYHSTYSTPPAMPPVQEYGNSRTNQNVPGGYPPTRAPTLPPQPAPQSYNSYVQSQGYDYDAYGGTSQHTTQYQQQQTSSYAAQTNYEPPSQPWQQQDPQRTYTPPQTVPTPGAAHVGAPWQQPQQQQRRPSQSQTPAQTRNPQIPNEAPPGYEGPDGSGYPVEKR